jgi:hypothetical protein
MERCYHSVRRHWRKKIDSAIASGEALCLPGVFLSFFTLFHAINIDPDKKVRQTSNRLN